MTNPTSPELSSAASPPALPQAPPTAIEASFVALCLSAVVRLRQAFERASSPQDQQALLQAAGDMLDHTLPFPEVRTLMSKTKPADQVQCLVDNRERIAAVPPGLWRAAKVRPNELGMSNYAGFRSVDRALRKDFSRPDLLWPTLSEWLEPAWEVYPQLRSECLALKAVTEGTSLPA